MELKNKVALVTGGAQGIGRTIGEELTQAGAHVVLGDINLEGAQATADAINKNGGFASAVKIDVSNATEVQQTFDLIMKEKKPVDIVVNKDTPFVKLQSMPRFFAANEHVQNAYVSPKGYWNAKDWTWKD